MQHYSGHGFQFCQNSKFTNSSICPHISVLSEKPTSSNHDEDHHFPCSSLGHLCLRGQLGFGAELGFRLRLPDALMPSSQCGGACWNNPRCTHFTWITQDGGLCLFKSGYVTRGNAVNVNDPSWTCRIIRS